MKLAFALCHHDSGSGVANDVGDNAGHVEDPVDTGQKSDGLQGKVDSVKDDGQHDQAGAGDACGTDGSQDGCDHDHDLLGNGQVDAEDLGCEDDGDGFIDGGAVHVHDCAEGDDEVCDLVGNAQLLGALKVDRNGGYGRAGGEYEEHGFLHGGEELDGADPCVEADHETALYEYGVEEAGQVAGEDGLEVGKHDAEAVLAYDVGHKSEYAEGSELQNDVGDLFPGVGPGTEEV